ncbi:sigma 54-interacting transcriptional regulator, partial [Sandarakinorhabdus sp.]|uniref:sigma 54-interacting transcriptional regulator n=1 Tax=Sandarakinorhabdus sp. TaxID=1916663 RepID=UPI003341487C
MSTPVPALPMPAPAWLPGLAAFDPGDLIVVIGDKRPQGLPLDTRRHVIFVPAIIGQARLAGCGLHIDVAPGDEAWALALAAAFARPDHPAAADPASRALLDLARRVGATSTGVLIEGPTGTGKEGLARLVHAASARRTRPLVAVNCAALADQMVEATLFGHERGAFTGAVQSSPGLVRSADSGTLFLDEVGELPLAAQAKLLRVLQEREVQPVGAGRPVAVDVRIIAAGNRDLAGEVAAGRFRADLYWRLAVFPLRTLPLAARPGDILAIAAHWLLGRAVGDGLVPWLTAAARGRLLAHGWPGNARELGNVLDRALVLCDGPDIGINDLVIDAGPPLAPGGSLYPQTTPSAALPGELSGAL